MTQMLMMMRKRRKMKKILKKSVQVMTVKRLKGTVKKKYGTRKHLVQIGWRTMMVL